MSDPAHPAADAAAVARSGPGFVPRGEGPESEPVGDVPVWDDWVGPDGRLIYVSAACAEVCGYTAAELLAQPGLMERMLDPKDRPRWRAHLAQRVLASTAATSLSHPPMEFRLTARDGGTRWIEHRCRPLYDSNGDYLGRRGVNLDVTDRKRAEQALARGSRLYATQRAFNQALLRVADQQALLEALCNIVVETGGLRGCVASLYDPESRRLRAVAWGGLEPDQATRMPLHANQTSDRWDSPRILSHQGNGSLPTMHAWQSGELHLCRDCGGDNLQAAWRDWTQQSGVGACCHVPFSAGGEDTEEPAGLISYLAADATRFDDALIALLGDLTADLSFGLAHLRRAVSEARARAALMGRERHLNALFQASPVGVALLVDRVFQEVNDRLCELTGYRRDEMLGHSVRMLHPSEPAFEAVGSELYPRLRREGLARMEARLRCKNGQVLDVDLSIALLSKTEPELGAICTVLDITEARRARSLLEARVALSEPAARGDVEALLAEAMHRAEQLTHSRYGYVHFLDPDREHLPKRSWSSRQIDDDRDGYGHPTLAEQGLWAECARRRAPVMRDGVPAPALPDGPLPNQAPSSRELAVPVERSGRLVAVFGVGEGSDAYTEADVDMLKHIASMTIDRVEALRVDALLRLTEERYQVAMQAASDGIWDWDLQTGQLAVNDAYLAMLGHAPDELPMDIARWRDMIHPQERGRVLALLAETMDSNEPSEIEYRLQTKDGGWCWVLSRGRVVSRDGRGRALRMAGTLTDISARRRAEEALRSNESLLRTVLEHLPVGVCAADVRGQLLYGNPEGRRIWGDGRSALAQDHGLPDDSPGPVGRGESVGTGAWAVQRAVRDGEMVIGEESAIEPLEGERRTILSSAIPIRDGTTGAITGAVLVNQDITERKAAEERLRQAAQVFESTSEGVIVTDSGGRIQAVNPAFTRITGYGEGEVRGKTPSVLRSGRHDAAFYAAMWEVLTAHGQWRGEVWNRRKDGEIYPEWLTISAVRDDGGHTSHYVAVFTDISVLKRSQEHLEFLARHDALTGLPNRLMLKDRLERALAKARRRRGTVALLFLDLDGFKGVNDSLGHAVGDQLLTIVARRMRERLRVGDTLGRLGGDEFLIVLEQRVREGDAARVAELLLQLLAEPIAIGQHELFISASIGISLYPDDGDDLDTLLRNADLAMYRAKDMGRNQYQFYAPELSTCALERHGLENALRGALGRGELLVHYQPQVELGSRRLQGVEALVRWQHPQLGLVPPIRFIPLAEDIGLISDIGHWVLREACRQLVAWRAAGIDVPRVAVNCSMQQIEGNRLLRAVEDILKETGLPPADLELEVTESMLMGQSARALETLNGLRARGVQLAVDDFGTGYSSLGRLHRLPIDRLKIDRSFIAEIGTKGGHEAIARAIIGLGADLGLDVIAEGVEHEDQARFLMGEGCHFAQGWLFGKALPADVFAARARANGGAWSG